MTTQPRRLLHLPGLLTAGLLLAINLSGCVYRVDVQQGNLLDDDNIASVQVGMTRSQVRFLLGTPIVSNDFRPDRWDYMYYLRRGRETEAEQRWVIVFFDGDTVKEVRRDVPVGTRVPDPSSEPVGTTAAEPGAS